MSMLYDTYPYSTMFQKNKKKKEREKEEKKKEDYRGERRENRIEREEKIG